MMLKSAKKIYAFFTADHQKSREMAYLNESVDVVDLEYRQRQIDKGLFNSGRSGNAFL